MVRFTKQRKSNGAFADDSITVVFSIKTDALVNCCLIVSGRATCHNIPFRHRM